MPHRVAILGFGQVGQGFAEIVLERGETLSRLYGLDVRVVSISDTLLGAVHHPDGLDLAEALRAVKESRSLDAYPSSPGLQRGWDSFRMIRETNADTVLELTYTDIRTGQPAIDHTRAAFEAGRNVVTSNKGPVALAYAELAALARSRGVRWGFEGTVMSGTPAIRMALVSLAGNEIRAVRGILNGTTNYILTRMEDGLSFDEALAEAQRLGYAEADPTNDVDGYDALAKVVILANVVMGEPLAVADVEREGIRHLTADDVRRAREEGCRWKLIGEARRVDGRVVASVGPRKIPVSDPLASVGGAVNAITYECDLSGPITLVGAGAGRVETGFAILADLLNIVRGGV